MVTEVVGQGSQEVNATSLVVGHSVGMNVVQSQGSQVTDSAVVASLVVGHSVGMNVVLSQGSQVTDSAVVASLVVGHSVGMNVVLSQGSQVTETAVVSVGQGVHVGVNVVGVDVLVVLGTMSKMICSTVVSVLSPVPSSAWKKREQSYFVSIVRMDNEFPFLETSYL